nr:hypothetical protein GCM10020092_063320 [Actinoplanes digitatis]
MLLSVSVLAWFATLRTLAEMVPMTARRASEARCIADDIWPSSSLPRTSGEWV